MLVGHLPPFDPSTRFHTTDIQGYLAHHHKTIFAKSLDMSKRVMEDTVRDMQRRRNHEDWKSAKEEGKIPKNRLDEEKSWALKMGLTGADSIEDKSIPTFSRGELPHFAGINTFLKAPYAEKCK